MTKLNRVMAVHTDPARPPAVGSFGSAEWSAERGRWVVRLTADGAERVAAWLAKYGSGFGLLRSKWPATYKLAKAKGLGDDDIAAECRLATSRAMLTYDPASALFQTYLGWHLRSAVQQAAGRGRFRPDDGAMVEDWQVIGDAGRTVGVLDTVSAADAGRTWGDAEAEAERADRSAAVRRLIDRTGLQPRQRAVLALRFGLDGGGARTLAEVAAAMGVSKERVRQLEQRALFVLREAMPGGVD